MQALIQYITAPSLAAQDYMRGDQTSAEAPAPNQLEHCTTCSAPRICVIPVGRERLQSAYGRMHARTVNTHAIHVYCPAWVRVHGLPSQLIPRCAASRCFALIPIAAALMLAPRARPNYSLACAVGCWALCHPSPRDRHHTRAHARTMQRLTMVQPRPCPLRPSVDDDHGRRLALGGGHRPPLLLRPQVLPPQLLHALPLQLLGACRPRPAPGARARA